MVSYQITNPVFKKVYHSSRGRLKIKLSTASLSLSLGQERSMAPMGQHHQMFLQALMSHHVVHGNKVKELYEQCCLKYNVSHDVNDAKQLVNFVNKINQSIRPLNMEIKKGISEDNGVHFYALVSMAEHSLTKLRSKYKENELQFFKAIIERVVQSGSGIVSSSKVLYLATDLEKKISMDEAQQLLPRFVEDCWLELSQGKVWLSSRSLLELSSYIKDIYTDLISDCHMCRTFAIRKQSCDQCNLTMHHHCASKCFEKRANKSCPNCHSPWPQNTLDGGIL